MLRGWRLARVMRCSLAIILLWVASGDSVKELPAADFPVEGALGPDTYHADAGLTNCVALDPYPSSAEVPWEPTVPTARTFCSALANCGGFVLTTPEAALAQGASALSTALYCQPQTFVTGESTALSGVAFVRSLYSSCDVRIELPSTAAHFHGLISFTRGMCVRDGRGLSPHRDRSAKPNAHTRRSRPKPTVLLDGTTYEVGLDVFILEADARLRSSDGLAHAMTAENGAQYFMPGVSHATRELFRMPLALDGYYPLYALEAAAQSASAQAGGNGQARSVGPGATDGVPARWTLAPHSQTYFMPVGGPTLYDGDYIAPFAVDGYFPLYTNEADAQKASSSGSAQSHGPGSDQGHPLFWSSGEHAAYFMPGEGPDKFYGNYSQPADGAASLYATVLVSRASRGETTEAASAMQAVAAAALATNSAAAAATLIAAPASR